MALSLEIQSMLPLHAVPSWCTLYVSTSAVLDVFSLGDPLLASASGSGSGQEIRGSGVRFLLCHMEEEMLPSWAGAGPAPQASHPGRMRRRAQNKDPVLLTGRFLTAGRSLVCVLERGFNPI